MNNYDRRTFLRRTTAAGLAASTRGLSLPSPAAAAALSTQANFDDPLGVRAQFPVTQELAYLNTASQGPMPRPVQEAVTAYAEERMTFRNPGRQQATFDRARGRFASLFGACLLYTSPSPRDS